MPAAHEDAVSDFPIIPGYEITAKLGQGAMGSVYRARYTASGREVALKVLNSQVSDDPQLVERFEREIAALRKLKHPNIATALGYGAAEDCIFLALEFIDGPDLSTLLKEEGPMSEYDVARIVLQVARALQFAHTSAGLIHRDIKPSNLLLSGDRIVDPQIKVIDFGLARSTRPTDDRLTLQGAVLGTPYYMSPEQINGSSETDIRTDIYGLGATAYHLLTGSHPFPGANPVEILTGHLTKPVPNPRELVPGASEDMSRMLMMAMQKDPAQRYLDYNGLIVACEKVLKKILPVIPSLKAKRPAGEPHASSALRQAVTSKITKMKTKRITRKPE
jgi:eukaryotic-like serine/threonine-protein kinase